MSRYSKTNKYDLSHPVPIFIIPEMLPGEYFEMITTEAAENVLPYYAISNYGRIWHIYANHFMSTSWDGPGYRIAVLRTTNGAQTFRVHRLVMLTHRYPEYIQYKELHPGENIVVNHIDGTKTRNYIDFPGIQNPDNLEWNTSSENEIHAYANNLKPLGEDSPNSKLTNERVEEICKQIDLGNLTSQQISDINNVSLATIENIRFGRSWKHISCKYHFTDKYKGIRF